MKDFDKVRVVSGQYAGREGWVKNSKDNQNLVMFYSKEGEFPYRSCLESNQVEVISEYSKE